MKFRDSELKFSDSELKFNDSELKFSDSELHLANIETNGRPYSRNSFCHNESNRKEVVG